MLASLQTTDVDKLNTAANPTLASTLVLELMGPHATSSPSLSASGLRSTSLMQSVRKLLMVFYIRISRWNYRLEFHMLKVGALDRSRTNVRRSRLLFKEYFVSIE
jgi:hypothetical protein